MYICGSIARSPIQKYKARSLSPQQKCACLATALTASTVTSTGSAGLMAQQPAPGSSNSLRKLVKNRECSTQRLQATEDTNTCDPARRLSGTRSGPAKDSLLSSASSPTPRRRPARIPQPPSHQGTFYPIPTTLNPALKTYTPAPNHRCSQPRIPTRRVNRHLVGPILQLRQASADSSSPLLRQRGYVYLLLSLAGLVRRWKRFLRMLFVRLQWPSFGSGNKD